MYSCWNLHSSSPMELRPASFCGGMQSGLSELSLRSLDVPFLIFSIKRIVGNPACPVGLPPTPHLFVGKYHEASIFAYFQGTHLSSLKIESVSNLGLIFILISINQWYYVRGTQLDIFLGIKGNLVHSWTFEAFLIFLSSGCQLQDVSPYFCLAYIWMQILASSFLGQLLYHWFFYIMSKSGLGTFIRDSVVYDLLHTVGYEPAHGIICYL